MSYNDKVNSYVESEATSSFFGGGVTLKVRHIISKSLFEITKKMIP